MNARTPEDTLSINSDGAYTGDDYNHNEDLGSQ